MRHDAEAVDLRAVVDSTEPADEAAAEDAYRRAYEGAGLRPCIGAVVWLPSPGAAIRYIVRAGYKAADDCRRCGNISKHALAESQALREWYAAYAPLIDRHRARSRGYSQVLVERRYRPTRRAIDFAAGNAARASARPSGLGLAGLVERLWLLDDFMLYGQFGADEHYVVERATALGLWPPAHARGAGVDPRAPGGGIAASAHFHVARACWQAARAAGPWWPFARAVVACERPLRVHRDPDGRLHGDGAPAIAYKDGFAVYAWHGTLVHEHHIMTPVEEINAQAIDAERNAEGRRVLIERLGYERYMREVGTLVQQDDCGKLWQRAGSRESPWVEAMTVVEVVNATPEPNGTYKRYWLRVPPATTTAKQGVAWTFGLREEEYDPRRET